MKQPKMFVMVDCVREMTVKKSCKYGEYGSFEHLLFLVVMCLFQGRQLYVFKQIVNIGLHWDTCEPIFEG